MDKVARREQKQQCTLLKKLSLLLMALSEGKRENPVLQVINAGFVTSLGSEVHLQNHRGMLQ